MTLPISFAGAEFILDLSGALYWPGQELLVVADLHFEKGSSFAARAYRPLPPHDTAQTLMRLHALVEHYRPRQVICLGDSFHDARASDRLSDGDLVRLRFLTEGCGWVWITGNHDPAVPAMLGGEAVERMVIDDIAFQHDLPGEAASDLTDRERAFVFGHFHPVAMIAFSGHLVRRRCFVLGDRRLLMPAFGAYTGGLNVLDPAIMALFPRGYEALLLGRDRMHRLLPGQLRPDTSYAMSRRLPKDR